MKNIIFLLLLLILMGCSSPSAPEKYWTEYSSFSDSVLIHKNLTHIIDAPNWSGKEIRIELELSGSRNFDYAVRIEPDENLNLKHPQLLSFPGVYTVTYSGKVVEPLYLYLESRSSEGLKERYLQFTVTVYLEV